MLNTLGEAQADTLASTSSTSHGGPIAARTSVAPSEVSAPDEQAATRPMASGGATKDAVASPTASASNGGELSDALTVLPAVRSDDRPTNATPPAERKAGLAGSHSTLAVSQSDSAPEASSTGGAPRVGETSDAGPSRSPSSLATPPLKGDVEVTRTPATFEEALRQDHSLVLKPDYATPFKSAQDVVQRLLPYHVYNVPEEDLAWSLSLSTDRKGKGKAISNAADAAAGANSITSAKRRRLGGSQPPSLIELARAATDPYNYFDDDEILSIHRRATALRKRAMGLQVSLSGGKEKAAWARESVYQLTRAAHARETEQYAEEQEGLRARRDEAAREGGYEVREVDRAVSNAKRQWERDAAKEQRRKRLAALNLPQDEETMNPDALGRSKSQSVVDDDDPAPATRLPLAQPKSAGSGNGWASAERLGKPSEAPGTPGPNGAADHSKLVDTKSKAAMGSPHGHPGQQNLTTESSPVKRPVGRPPGPSKTPKPKAPTNTTGASIPRSPLPQQAPARAAQSPMGAPKVGPARPPAPASPATPSAVRPPALPTQPIAVLLPLSSINHLARLQIYPAPSPHLQAAVEAYRASQAGNSQAGTSNAPPNITSAHTSPRPSPAAQEELALLMGITEATHPPHELMLNLSVLLTKLSPQQLQGLAALMQAQSKYQQEQQAKSQGQGSGAGAEGPNGSSAGGEGAGSSQGSSAPFKPPQTRPPSDPVAAAAAVSSLAASCAAAAAQRQAASVPSSAASPSSALTNSTSALQTSGGHDQPS